MKKFIVRTLLTVTAVGAGYAIRQAELKWQLKTLAPQLAEEAATVAARQLLPIFKYGFNEALKHPECQSFLDYENLYMTKPTS